MSTPPEGRFVSRATRETLALVMAGGRGSRLKQLTANTAKPAVPFGGKFRIIDFTLSNCINSGVRRVGVLTQYKSHALIRHLQMGWGFMRGQFGEFVELLPAEQRSEGTSWYIGTADAVYQNIPFIRQHQPAHVLILAGDHIYKMDYGPMIAQHVANNAKVTVGCLEVPLGDATEFGVMTVDAGNRVVAFDEKPLQPKPMPGKTDVALASMGIYVFDARFLLDTLSKDAGVSESSHDFGHDIIPRAIAESEVFAYPFRDLYDSSKQGYWRDVGTVDAFWKANLELTDVLPELNLYDTQWPIWTHAVQLPPAKFILDKPDARGYAIDSMVSAGCIIAGAEVRNSVLFNNTRVETGSSIAQSVVLPGVTIGRNCRINKAVIDEGCVIPDGTEIGEGTAGNASWYHVTKSGVTLVTPEMLED
ncbi:MAG: glucose-1-phosphate adenylyltransferase [Gammaproteobacteria bacterium]|uniref:glucose-1-phosphate adenylyltransferase n=1 Tax=Nevskia sp. TaxID=1929292 RepID=UPI0040354699|nr:glucose-1-phosphate adenylyltransferase [Gammaproteobacteria bacterium]